MTNESLGTALPKEMARVREVLSEYKKIGPNGMFGAQMIELDLKAADSAVMSGDVIEMMRVYEVLKNVS